MSFLLKNPPARRLNAFTLVELLVVVAILGILAIVAIPAYNTYSLKAKFSENVLATAPLKTFIATCAASGDCIVSNAISFSGPPPASSLLPTNLLGMTQGPDNSSLAAFYGYFYAAYSAAGQTSATAATNAQNNATTYAGSPYWIGGCVSSSGSVCMHLNSVSNGDYFAVASLSSVASAYANNDPYVVAGSANPTVVPPCVGTGAGCSPMTKYVASVSNNTVGVITATAQATSGLNSETFVLVPSYSSGRVDWSASGTCKTRASGAIC